MTLSNDATPNRRATDRDLHRVWAQRLHTWTGHAAEPVRGGRLMLLATGIVTSLTMPLLEHRHLRALIVGTLAVTFALWCASLFVSWTRLPRHALLAFPTAAWIALAGLGAATHGIAASYSGFFVLWFAYIGLTQRSGTSVALAPIAIIAYVTAWGGFSEALLARLVVAVSIWLLLAELLAAMVRRQRMMTDELRAAAHIDPLTKLANRRDLDLRMASAEVGDALIICDLDHFKSLNDTQGHAAGDLVLAEFGLILRTCLRQFDYAARYGGEEFALLLPATDRAQAAATMARIRQCWALLQPGVTFSAGIALCRPDRSVLETMAAADRALYGAKAAGRNRDHSDAVVPALV